VKQTWLVRLLARSLRLTRRCVSKFRGSPLAKGTRWDWYDPVGAGIALIGGSITGSWRSLLRGSPLIATFVLAAVLIGANLILLGLRRRRRDILSAWVSAGCCPRCGYDRRGNVAGVCPECGGPVRRHATAEADDKAEQISGTQIPK
jgi:hypothetical protein